MVIQFNSSLFSRQKTIFSVSQTRDGDGEDSSLVSILKDLFDSSSECD